MAYTPPIGSAVDFNATTTARKPLTLESGVPTELPDEEMVDLADVALSGDYADLTGTPDPADYATAAQGALADSATQPGDLATVATTGAYTDLTGTPDPADYATAAQGALADSATQPEDLGNSAPLDVGTVAGTVAAGDHTHAGVYEPADATILKDADIGSTVAAEGHDHSGVYEPADATILKDADIGVTVAAEGHDHSGVYEPADATILKDADIGSTVLAYMSQASQAEMEAGTETALRSMSPVNVKQAVDAVVGSSAPSQLTASFVASGEITEGLAVVLNSDGTISTVASGYEPVSAGTPSVFEPGSFTSGNSACVYDSTADKVVIAYKDSDNNGYGTAVVGTVSGTTITFGSPVVFASSNSNHISVAYDSTAGKVVIAYQDTGNSYYGTAVVGTVSGTTITFGSPVVFESANSSYISAAYDSAAGKIVIAYRDEGNSYYGTAVVGTVSGTAITFGTPVVFKSAATSHISIAYDSAAGKVVIAYQNVGDSNRATASVGTLSGTAITFGTSVRISYATPYNTSVCFDAATNKIVIVYLDYSDSYAAKAIVGTVSGTTITFGTLVVVKSSTVYSVSVCYASAAGKVVFAYQDNNNGNYGTAVVGTVSGTTITLGSPVVFESAYLSYVSIVYDSSADKLVISYRDQGNSGYGTAVILSLESNQSRERYIGFAAQSATDAESINVAVSGVVDGQSGLTCLSSYWLDVHGDLTASETEYAKVGVALSPTSLLLAPLQ